MTTTALALPRSEPVRPTVRRACPRCRRSNKCWHKLNRGEVTACPYCLGKMRACPNCKRRSLAWHDLHELRTNACPDCLAELKPCAKCGAMPLQPWAGGTCGRCVVIVMDDDVVEDRNV